MPITLKYAVPDDNIENDLFLPVVFYIVYEKIYT